MNNEHSVSAHWQADFDEAGLRDWAEGVRAQLKAPQVSLGLVFMTPRFFPYAKQVLEILRVHARIPLLAGCSSMSLVAGEEELEDNPGLVLALYSLPGAKLTGTYFDQAQVEAAEGHDYWHGITTVKPSQTNGWLTFIDPFHLDSESWLRSWNENYPGSLVYGGLSSGIFADQATQVYLNGEVYDEGGVAISVGGDVKLAGVISQGCTPIGDTWTLTRVEQNMIHKIANRPAYEVLSETVNEMSTDEQKKVRGNLFIGLVVNEYLEEFHRGDFLVRNLLGGDPQTGVLAVGAMPRAGQTMQFQRRDAEAASEDMSELLERTKTQLGGATIYGGCLCCCNGRGRHLFGTSGHDAQMVQKQFGGIGLSGFFCNGEIGPVGQKNFLHGYTASLALFVKK
ncbi:MAG: FIST C-terminal domain-containing protein [Verrucomicrobiota bacterium]